MKKLLLFTSLLLGTLLISACGTAPAAEPQAEPPAVTSNTAVTEQAGGRMGMGGGMMARHHAQVPQPYNGMINPVPADEDSLARGAETYANLCATCHGDGGMGDGPTADALDPAPAAIAHTSQMLGDDYQYWRVSEGGAMEPFNSGMIAWKTVLDEQERWDVINYVQALGSGEVMPGQNMGGMPFSPEFEAEKQAQMLSDGVSQGVITEEESAVFAAAHEKVDGRMMEMRADGAQGSMDDMMGEILDALVASGDLTQVQADIFLSVHDRLGNAGLMQ